MGDKPKERGEAKVRSLVEAGYEKVGEEEHAHDGQADRDVVFSPGCERLLSEGPGADFNSEDKLGIWDDKDRCPELLARTAFYPPP